MNVRCWPKMNMKRGMTIYAGILIGNYAKNMAFKDNTVVRAQQWYKHEPDGVMENKDSVEFYNPVLYQD